MIDEESSGQVMNCEAMLTYWRHQYILPRSYNSIMRAHREETQLRGFQRLHPLTIPVYVDKYSTLYESKLISLPILEYHRRTSVCSVCPR